MAESNTYSYAIGQSACPAFRGICNTPLPAGPVAGVPAGHAFDSRLGADFSALQAEGKHKNVYDKEILEHVRS